MELEMGPDGAQRWWPVDGRSRTGIASRRECKPNESSKARRTAVNTRMYQRTGSAPCGTAHKTQQSRRIGTNTGAECEDVVARLGGRSLAMRLHAWPSRLGSGKRFRSFHQHGSGSSHATLELAQHRPQRGVPHWRGSHVAFGRLLVLAPGKVFGWPVVMRAIAASFVRCRVGRRPYHRRSHAGVARL